MDDTYFKKIITSILFAVLVVLTFFMVKPILLSVIFGLILAFIFIPVYLWLNKHIKSKNISAVLISLALILAILIPVWLLSPILVKQSLAVYSATQKMDFVTPLKSFFPSIFASEQFSREIGSVIFSFVNKSINSFVNSLSQIVLNFPVFFLQLLVAAFTFFFVLRDHENLLSYIQSLLPFSKEVEKKLFEQTKEITTSILYGEILLGLAQGIVTGISFFIFNVPNALLLTLLSCLAGVFPLIGTTIIWVAVMIYLFVIGNFFAAIGVLIFGIIALFLDNVLKPIFVSHRTSLPTSIVVVGMIGGFFLFGVLGFIIGPLILAYLLIILEIYRNKRIPGILIQEESPGTKISFK